MELELIRKKEEAKGTVSFLFRGKVSYRAGQFLILKAGGDERKFSFSSSPTEESIMVTTRLTGSKFKEELNKLPEGTKLKASGPFGMLTMRDEKEGEVRKEYVFIAGGIGSTPLRSMAKDATDRKLKNRITLFYFDKTRKDMAFLHDFEVMAAKNRNFKFVPVMTKEKWKGETGYLREDLLKRYLAELSGKLFYISGAPSHVSAMASTLMKLKVPASNIITEEFMGYK